MASAASSDPADGELIKQCSFSKGEWKEDYQVDVGFSNIYELFGTPGNVGYETLGTRCLLAVAFAAGEQEQLMLDGPESFLAMWESKAEARSVRPPETGAAATNAYNTAMNAADSSSARIAVKVVKATQGTMSLMGSVRNLPMVNGARLSLAAFPRLQKIAPRSTMLTSRLRDMAARVSVVLPDDADTSDKAREEWVWSLSMLTRSITTKAVGFLAIAHASSEAWTDAIAALGTDGRFKADYMAEIRRQLRESRAAAAGPAAGKFDATVTPLAAWNHAAGDIADADVAERVAKAVANATTGFHNITVVGAGFEVRKIAVGTALLNTMRTRDQALTTVPKMPAAEDVAIECLLGYLYTGQYQELQTVTPTGPPTGAATAAGTAVAGPTMMVLSPETIELLRPATTETMALTGSDKIVLGKAPTSDGTLKRPEYFAVGDVSDFQRHEGALSALEATDKNLDNKEFLRMYRALPETARSLVEVPVYPADLARNHCLNVLSALADRISAAGDDLILKGTILSKYRESETQRQQDRERAKNIAKLRQGDFIEAGPQICEVNHCLATAYDFLQIPYMGGKVASAINGDWDSTWYLWAEVAESQLGKECDVVAGVEKVVKTIRQDSRKGDDPWCDQQRADYGAVALFYFTRDYRRWREKWPGAERPSLLRVLTGMEFAKYMVRAFDYANKPEMRPDVEPYNRMRLGMAPVKRKFEKITATQLFADESDGDDDSTQAAPLISKRAKKREEAKKKKKKAADGKPPPTTGGGAAGDARKRRDDKDAGGGGGGAPGGGAPPGGGDKRKPPPKQLEWVNVEGGGSAWPDMNHRLNNEQCAVLQAKLDVSDGIDKGSCACFYFGETGCAKDKRAGVVGKCGWSHGAPADRKEAFTQALCKTANMAPPMRLKNQRVWNDTPSGHNVKTLAVWRPPSPAASVQEAKSDDDDDDA